MKTQHWAKALDLAARIHVFLFLNVYGLGKIAGNQFYRKGHLPPEIAEQKLGDVSSFDLAWTFFGHSTAYILFIGMTQLLGAWLLLWNRTKMIGIAILIPVMLNIVVLDALFEVEGAIISAAIYLGLLLLVLWLNRSQVRHALAILTQAPTVTFPREGRWVAAGVTAGMLVLMLFVEQFLLNLSR